MLLQSRFRGKRPSAPAEEIFLKFSTQTGVVATLSMWPGLQKYPPPPQHPHPPLICYPFGWCMNMKLSEKKSFENFNNNTMSLTSRSHRGWKCWHRWGKWPLAKANITKWHDSDLKNLVYKLKLTAFSYHIAQKQWNKALFQLFLFNGQKSKILPHR